MSPCIDVFITVIIFESGPIVNSTTGGMVGRIRRPEGPCANYEGLE